MAAWDDLPPELVAKILAMRSTTRLTADIPGGYLRLNRRYPRVNRRVGLTHPRPTMKVYPPQPCTPEIIGRAPGEKVKRGGGKGGDASPPEDSR
eukprot:scaffold5637_cov121-Isochrysis_galbana.AAC.6